MGAINCTPTIYGQANPGSHARETAIETPGGLSNYLVDTDYLARPPGVHERIFNHHSQITSHGSHARVVQRRVIYHERFAHDRCKLKSTNLREVNHSGSSH